MSRSRDLAHVLIAAEFDNSFELDTSNRLER